MIHEMECDDLQILGHFSENHDKNGLKSWNHLGKYDPGRVSG